MNNDKNQELEDIQKFDFMLKQLRKEKVILQRAKGNIKARWLDLALRYSEIGAEANAQYCLKMAAKYQPQPQEFDKYTNEFRLGIGYVQTGPLRMTAEEVEAEKAAAGGQYQNVFYVPVDPQDEEEPADNSYLLTLVGDELERAVAAAKAG